MSTIFFTFDPFPQIQNQIREFELTLFLYSEVYYHRVKILLYIQQGKSIKAHFFVYSFLIFLSILSILSSILFALTLISWSQIILPITQCTFVLIKLHLYIKCQILFQSSACLIISLSLFTRLFPYKSHPFPLFFFYNIFLFFF